MKKALKVLSTTKVLHSAKLDRLVTLEAIDTILSASKRGAVLHISFSDEKDMNDYIENRLDDIDGCVVTGKTVSCDFGDMIGYQGFFDSSAATELEVEEHWLRKLGFYEIEK